MARKIRNSQLLTTNDLSRLQGAAVADQMNAKRDLREILFAAWEIHKSNVAYGVEFESEEEHGKCLVWYFALKDLEDWAFTEIPEGVKQYLKK